MVTTRLGIVFLMGILAAPPSAAADSLRPTPPTVLEDPGSNTGTPYLVIETPGLHVLDGDVRSDDGPAILIAASDVKLDLGCNRVVSTTTGIVLGDGVTNITIRNGAIEANQGIEAASVGRVRMESLELRKRSDSLNRAVDIDAAEFVEMLDCRIIEGVPRDEEGGVVDITAASGRIIGNHFADNSDRNLVLRGFNGGEIARNSFIGGRGTGGLSAMKLIGGNANRVVHNNLSGMRAGLTFEGCDNNVIGWNVIHEAEEGGLLAGTGNLIIENTLNSNGDVLDGPSNVWIGSYNVFRGNQIRSGAGGEGATLTGLTVLGTRNLIEDNLIEQILAVGQGAGIRFESGSSNNSYRDNLLRGNSVPVVDDGSGNTDDGGNVF
jgi:hypothetical protein